MKNHLAPCFQLLSQIENVTNEPTLLLVAPMLDIEILPSLYNVISTFPKDASLTLVVFGRGGATTSARAIAVLLRKYCNNLTILVPHYCQSSFTALTLSADRIIAGDMAIFSPIDPSLNCEPQGALASEDIRLFSKMSKDWFGIESEDTKTELLAALASNVFPTTLSTLYRTSIEMKEIALELIHLGNPHLSKQTKEGIVDKLLHGYHSHSFPINNDDLEKLGLTIVRDENLEAIGWKLVQHACTFIGGAARTSLSDTKNDVLIATSSRAKIRQSIPNAFGPTWLDLENETR